jgi:peptidoglycan/LPS O-acetylase OafA/YrhL
MRIRALDGLRGWGAVFVVLYHVFVEGLPVSAGSAGLLKRLIPFNGTLAVLVFFLVSGFSLSVRYLADSDLRAWTQIAAGRYFRLVIPIFVACLLVHLAMVAGAIDVADHRIEKFRGMLNFDPTFTHLLRFSLFDVFFNYSADGTGCARRGAYRSPRALAITPALGARGCADVPAADLVFAGVVSNRRSDGDLL